MKKYKTDKNALSIPWIESPFFLSLLTNSKHSPEEVKMLISYFYQGYVIVDLELNNKFINGLKTEINTKIKENLIKQDSRYEYSDSPRVFEAWRDCPSVLELTKHPKIINTLKLLYNKDPKPFQTINFIKGSNQPLHSDAIHFHTTPAKWMAGVWIALEDMTEDNGTLCYVPGSHKWDIYEFPDLKLDVPEFGEQFEAYSEYEYFLTQLMETKSIKEEKFIQKKGKAIIWAANMLHGGTEIKDPNSTRWSQAIHYYFDDCAYYCPLFSDKHQGKFSYKDVTSKDILNYTISE